MPVIPGPVCYSPLHHRSYRMQNIFTWQIIRMRMFCGSCFFLVSLPFHDTGTFRTKLYATVGMNCIINTAVTRAKTPQHLRICGIDNLVAAQRGDIALPEIQSGLLPLKILICPVETTLMLISDRWKVLIIRDLLTGTKRFSELFHRLISGHSVSFPDTVSSFPICVPLKKPLPEQYDDFPYPY